jgi:hypothetical protein
MIAAELTSRGVARQHAKLSRELLASVPYDRRLP